MRSSQERGFYTQTEIKFPSEEAANLPKRKSFPRDVETAVLTKCRRRCAFCFVLENDITAKPGEIAHIDRDPSNASLENAAYLCMGHHDEYDSTPSQTKGLTPDELREHQAMLYEFLSASGPWPSATASKHRGRKRPKIRVSLDVYDRRVPIYRTVVKFLRYVMQDMNPAYPVIFQFVADTDEARFLFDDTIADYLAELSNASMRSPQCWSERRMGLWQ